MRLLYRNDFESTDINNLYAFIDWCIKLPDPLAIQYNNEILRLEEKLNMPYITTAERLEFQRGMQEGNLKGREEGIEKGMEKGELLLLQRQLAHKFGKISIHFCQQLQQASAEALLQLADRILDAKTLDDVFNRNN